MAVHPKRHPRIGVADPRGDRVDIHAVLKQVRDVRVPQVVEPDRRKSRLDGQPSEFLADEGWIKRVAVRLAEDRREG